MFCTVNLDSDDEPVASAPCGKCGAKSGEPCDDMGQKTIRSEMNKLDADARDRERPS